ncbi:hypothetical protein I302_104069 [Kwoniella bestiolae CBS 10118]|uniref:Non-structural maintenance of chromosomes element 1 homolog n=1 Tax=Kwoniella bestiolae CBS 10118 TaxID=1296100 RepID=A0A1B9GA73_9TREE|nr:hypothetical protein I302_02774 [Kwoniella bestiolae CBS 10118]OCF27924.1 hypothetical protein I302_02774 [Kwoniella bestiolae CBS 10118]
MSQTHHVRSTNLHRLFIQSMLSRRAIKEDVALEMYKRAVGACQAHDDTFRPLHDTTLRGFRTFITDVSDILHDLGMEVVLGQEQSGTGKSWVVLRNTDPSEVALQATDYTPLEIDYYRRVVKEIIESYPANSISHNQATSIVSELEGTMAKHVAESLLESLCSRGWLLRSKRRRYVLGVRAIAELETYLKQQFEDYMQNCKQCKRVMLDGVCCSKEGCEAHFHSYCYTSLLKLPRPACPECKSKFSEYEPTPIGEKAVSRAEDDFRGLRKKRKRPSAAQKGKGKSRAGEDGDGDGDTDEDDELEDEEGEGGESGFIDKAGPSGWKVDSTSRRRSVVPETQYLDDEAEDDDDEEEQSATQRRKSRR